VFYLQNGEQYEVAQPEPQGYMAVARSYPEKSNIGHHHNRVG
jgi:hypothetical protein